MRETLNDWKKEWIQTNGITDDVEVLITDSSSNVSAYAYEGSFAQIPEDLLHRKVIQYGKVVVSSIEERNGAYSLTV